MVNILKKIVIGTMCYVALTGTANAKILDYNHAFTYAELGAEIVSYGETTTVLGEPLLMNAAVVNVAQRSGGYTPLGEFGGFYVQTATTLDPLPADEDWNIGRYGVVQTNERKVRWNELNVMASWLVRDTGYHFVGGIAISTLAFIRSGFKEGPGAQALRTDIQAIDPYANFSVPSGAVTEDSTHVSANIGLRYDSTFLDPDEETRFLWSISAGTPIYYKVENSNYPGARWVEFFHGYNVAANIGYGIQMYEQFMLSTQLEIQYKKRFETSGQQVAGGVGRIPEVTIWNTRITVGAEWNY